MLARCFPNEQLEKLRSFKPPVTKKLGVERDDDDWIDLIIRGELAKLRTALFQKMRSMCVGCFFGCGAIVKFLLDRKSVV